MDITILVLLAVLILGAVAFVQLSSQKPEVQELAPVRRNAAKNKTVASGVAAASAESWDVEEKNTRGASPSPDSKKKTKKFDPVKQGLEMLASANEEVTIRRREVRNEADEAKESSSARKQGFVVVKNKPHGAIKQEKNADEEKDPEFASAYLDRLNSILGGQFGDNSENRKRGPKPDVKKTEETDAKTENTEQARAKAFLDKQKAERLEKDQAKQAKNTFGSITKLSSSANKSAPWAGVKRAPPAKESAAADATEEAADKEEVTKATEEEDEPVTNDAEADDAADEEEEEESDNSDAAHEF